MYAAAWAAGLLPGGAPLDSADSVIALGSGVAFLAVLVSVFCAIPAVSWLSDRRPLSLERLLLLGAALGNVPFAVIVIMILVQSLWGTPSAADGPYWAGGAVGAAVRILMGAVIGAGSAAVLWFVTIQGNDHWSAETR
jgi:hypothetical protein